MSLIGSGSMRSVSGALRKVELSHIIQRVTEASKLATTYIQVLAMTVAAIDRLVHHSVILEMNTDSYRRKSAETKRPGK
jgi:DNA replication protein DnaC